MASSCRWLSSEYCVGMCRILNVPEARYLGLPLVVVRLLLSELHMPLPSTTRFPTFSLPSEGRAEGAEALPVGVCQGRTVNLQEDSGHRARHPSQEDTARADPGSPQEGAARGVRKITGQIYCVQAAFGGTGRRYCDCDTIYEPPTQGTVMPLNLSYAYVGTVVFVLQHTYLGLPTPPET